MIYKNPNYFLIICRAISTEEIMFINLIQSNILNLHKNEKAQIFQILIYRLLNIGVLTHHF